MLHDLQEQEKRGGNPENAQNAINSPLDSLINIRVVKNDARTFSTKLEADFLQVASCGCFHDLPTRESTPSKCNLVDYHAFTDRLTRGVTIAGHDVDYPGWETSFSDQCG
jgi:hypothetical protein